MLSAVSCPRVAELGIGLAIGGSPLGRSRRRFAGHQALLGPPLGFALGAMATFLLSELSLGFAAGHKAHLCTAICVTRKLLISYAALVSMLMCDRKNFAFFLNKASKRD